MGSIEIISASAGSGKTHTLTELLKQRLKDGQVRPEAIVATTFTNRAAAELQERVRTALLRSGRASDAQVLTSSRMGTVNAVCSRLLSDFCFELGMPPVQRVLDEDQAEMALRRAVSQVVTPAETAELERLRRCWPTVEWQVAVKEIVDHARANGLGLPALEDCARRSAEGYGGLFETPSTSGDSLDAELRSRLQAFLRQVDLEADATRKTAGTVLLARNCLNTIGRDAVLVWADWLRLANAETGKTSEEAYRPVRQAAATTIRHPRLIAEGQRIIALVFQIAGRALEVYDAYKVHNGLVDFVDQEVKALHLLDHPDVRERLGSTTDLVLVDEFQDTSPLQLAIFLKLASLAPHSIWVGDQKQAIYGFRGTDSRLMDAAIDGILGASEPRTLRKSWRSRPGLVRLTSALFASAFEQHGLNPDRVRLEPAREVEPGDLGPFVESWSFTYPKGESSQKNASRIANGIQQLLADPDARVRSDDDASRPIRRGDIAVLCRTNHECALIASELQAIGIRSAIPRAGLLASLESHLVMAGLQLWADPEDRLAVAVLEKLVTLADKPDDWLQSLLEAGRQNRAMDSRLAQAIAQARDRDPLAGPLTVFDRVIEAIQVREHCLAWGDADERLANLDALRAHAATYLKGQSGAGGGQGTVAGLLAFLQDLAGEDRDTQATLLDENAVVVTTWHKSKGLEWPVVVLNSLRSSFEVSPLGIQVVAPDRPLDLNDPLSDRWIRYWPRPFIHQQRRGSFFDRLSTLPEQAQATEEAAREDLRLLYVTWTRARDRVVLPGRSDSLQTGLLRYLPDAPNELATGAPPAGSRSGTIRTAWAGQTFALGWRAPEPGDPVRAAPQPAEAVMAPGPREHPAAFVNPSGLSGRGEMGEVLSIGEPIPLRGEPDPARFGEAVHDFLAADTPDRDGPIVRLCLAGDLLRRWGVEGSISPSDLLLMSNRLRAWMDERVPRAARYPEMSVLHRLPDGALVKGFCDLALQTEEGYVVIDHKTTHGPESFVADKVRSFAPQVFAYAHAIEAATGKRVVGHWVHLPIMARMIQLH